MTRFLLALSLLAPLLVSCRRSPPPAPAAPQAADLFPVHQDGRWGFIDVEGRVAIPFQFERAGLFSEGLAPVVPAQRNLGYDLAYINAKGQVVVKTRQHAWPPPAMTEGLLPAIAVDEPLRLAGDPRPVREYRPIRWGYYNAAGKRVIPAMFDSAFGFSGGRAPVRVNLEWGYIAPDGEVSIPLKFRAAGSFSEGVAPAAEADRTGFIDTTGGWVIAPRFAAALPFSEGLAAVQVEAPTGVHGRLWGFVDRAGREVIPAGYSQAAGFKEGLARVGLAAGGWNNDQWGFIDRTGAWRIPARHKGAGDFSDGVAPVLMDGKWAYVDTEGAVAIPPRFEAADGFRRGLAAVREGGQMKYIDRSGRVVWPAP